jgi:hypothetical protein
MADGLIARETQPWKPAIATVLTTLILAPLVGGFLVSVYLGAQFFGTVSGQPLLAIIIRLITSLTVFLAFLPYGLMTGFIMGGIQALVGGIVFAVYGWTRGRPPIHVPIVAGLVLSAFLLRIPIAKTGTLVFLTAMFHVLPALAAWAVIRSFWTEKQQMSPANG